jgi:hypothetical protein
MRLPVLAMAQADLNGGSSDAAQAAAHGQPNANVPYRISAALKKRWPFLQGADIYLLDARNG